MHALSGERLLQAWEKAEHQHGLRRALIMLALALPDSDPAQLAELPILERNRLLLKLRLLSFGPTLQSYATCSQCGSAMEFALVVEELLAGLDGQQASIEWQEDGHAFRMRSVNTLDLLATLDMADIEVAERTLLDRCLDVDSAHATSSTVTLPALANEKFEHLHAASELRCALHCPQCAQEDVCELDIASFLWLEVRNAAQRLFTDIHVLAQNYGWSESAIASMSAQRREAYLELTIA